VVTSLFGNAQMGQMYGVEGAAENAYLHGAPVCCAMHDEFRVEEAGGS
jgi:hypothetical protein